jgi:hypothetical protein
MTQPETGDQDAGAEKIGNGNNNTLFSGDSGELPFDTRRALVQLLLGPSLDERRHANLWPVLLRDKLVICKYLSEIFLELVIDTDLKVAFTRQADTDDLEIPTLLRRSQLTFMDSTLLLYLRQQLAQAQSQDERAVVTNKDMVAYLGLFEKTGNTDKAGFDKRIYASVKKMKKYHILQKIRNSEDRFEISPTLKLLFSAEEIQVLIKLFRKMDAASFLEAAGEPTTAASGAEDDDEAEGDEEE